MFAITVNWTFHIFQNVEAEEERVDDRSVDDLLSFINGEGIIMIVIVTCLIE